MVNVFNCASILTLVPPYYGFFSRYFFQMTTEAVEQPQQAEEKKPEVEVEAVG